MQTSSILRYSPSSSFLSLCAMCAATVAGLWLGAPSVARADITLAAEARYGTPVGAWTAEPGGGTGTELRLGASLGVPGLLVMPELVAFQHTFDATGGHETQYDAYRLGAGLRVGMGAVVRPSVFAHLGYGWLEGTGSDYVIHEDGMTMDLGCALDLTVLPLVDFGISASYVVLSHRDSPNPSLPADNAWVTAGAHVSITF